MSSRTFGGTLVFFAALMTIAAVAYLLGTIFSIGMFAPIEKAGDIELQLNYGPSYITFFVVYLLFLLFLWTYGLRLIYSNK